MRALKRNRREGQGLPGALLLVAIVSLCAAAVPQISSYINQRAQVTKVKSAMAVVGAGLRLKLSDSRSYTGCPGASCALLDPTLVVGRRLRSLVGVECPSTQPACGIQIATLTMASGVIDVRLHFEGLKPLVADETISVKIPQHSAHQVDCDVTRPVFQGVDSTGAAICKTLDRCPAGSFASSYDTHSLKPSCVSIPNRLFACGNGEYIGSVLWRADLSPQLSCRPRRQN